MKRRIKNLSIYFNIGLWLAPALSVVAAHPFLFFYFAFWKMKKKIVLSFIYVFFSFFDFQISQNKPEPEPKKNGKMMIGQNEATVQAPPKRSSQKLYIIASDMNQREPDEKKITIFFRLCSLVPVASRHVHQYRLPVRTTF